MRSILGFLCVIAIFSATSMAQQVSRVKPWTTKLELSISAKPDVLKEEIESYLRREIRALGDVEIVETKGNYRIEIVAFELTSKGGDVRGVAIATVLDVPFYWDTVNGALADLNDAKRKFLEQLTGLAIRSNFTLDTSARDDVPNLCRQIILNIDSHSFESERKMYRKAIEGLRAKGSSQ